MSTNTALLAPSAVAVFAARIGGTWFTYDADGFVIDAGLDACDAEDAVHAGTAYGQTLAEFREAEEVERDEWFRKWAGEDV